MSHILVVDDDENGRESLIELIRAEGHAVSGAGSLREAHILLARQPPPDVMLIDLGLPDGSGMDLIEHIDRRSTEIILITGNASVETAVEALRAGAADYLVKPVNFARLKTVLTRICRPADLKAQIGRLRGELRQLGHFERMIGKSAVMQALYDQIARVAPTEATVLLVGESGTGKEVAAQAIHDISRRSSAPFLAVNCGAIAPQLIESEMFGHERGSFTGANRQHRGYFERADGGTLFLDEITEMPIELQVKLLRVLETGRFMRIGTDREIEADVRIIAATNRRPEAAVQNGALRADLYHRLNVFPIVVPPLRERDGDIELLADHFLAELARSSGEAKTLSPAARKMLLEHSWPGNVRELRNVVQRAWIMSDDVIDAGAIQFDTTTLSPSAAPRVIEIPVGTSLEEVDRRLILATLEQCGGVKKRAAELLGISLKTLYNRRVEYGLQEAGHGAEDSDERGDVGDAEASDVLARARVRRGDTV
jgi:DNA-binding NtrC family response regulator